MRIKEIRCEQFAGLHDRAYIFEDGLNLIIGENESGKSTLVDLLYHLFFQNANLDGRKDKAFTTCYFPRTTGHYQGDAIDGVLRFETTEGSYKLSKEWAGKTGSAKLTLPDGTVMRDTVKINALLKELLGYGKGVYDELVFASQRRPQSILAGLLGGEASGNVSELASTITKAVMETGGVQLDAMEKELRDTVSSYEGHWDFEADMPEGGKKRGIGNRWQKGVGSILSAYYEKEEAAEKKSSAEEAEKRVDAINAELQSQKQALAKLRDTGERFSRVRSQIATLSANKQLLEKEELALEDMQTALREWPQKADALGRAKNLREEWSQAEIYEKHQYVRALQTEREDKQKRFDEIGEIRPEDAAQAIDLTKQIEKRETRLRGMNLSAQIRQLGNAEIQVKSAASGNLLDISGGTFDITEAVEICIPGVAEIQLAPKGVDVSAIHRELTEKRAQLSELLAAYGAESAEQLQEQQREWSDLNRDLKSLAECITAALGETAWETLQAEAAVLPANIRSKTAVKADISALCGGKSLDAFIGGISSTVEAYTQKYGNPKTLAAETNDQADTVHKLRDNAGNAETVPEEFAGIQDADEYDASLKNQIKGKEDRLEDLRAELSAAEKALGDKSAEEYADDYNKAKDAFERQLAEYRRWKHILNEFIKLKNSSQNNPLEDVERAFGENLAILSGGTIRLNEIREDLGSSISSGKSLLSADILSDGTKDTVALAFRLAVLKHLFPDGGCVAVFDDPFTDMDPKRTAQACRLLQSFAENNQVLFISCDEKYTDLLHGNVIQMAN